ncbi:MAG: efflux RND transporter periplasmic adaptor subunit [Balneolaceae bacterium]
MKRTTLAATLLFFLFAGCNGGAEQIESNGENSRLVPVETITVVPDDFEDYIRLTGVVEAIDDATLSAENSGQILSIRERGALVRRGETIASMDERMSRAQYEAAQTALELTEDTFERLSALYQDSIISTQDYNQARAQRDQARAQFTQTEKQLEDVRIEAPFDGRIEERMVNSGELVNPGMPVVRLVNTDRVRIIAGIPERYSGQISEGSLVVVRFRPYTGNETRTEISFAGEVIDSSTRTFAVEIEVDNFENRFKPEMVVDLRVRRETINNAVVIPRTAIQRDQEGASVFVASMEEGEKRAQMVPVVLGTGSGAVIEVVEGLQEGDEVVVTGFSTLSVGDRLNILSTMESSEKARQLQTQDRPTVSY